MLTLMLDPIYKSMRLVTIYVGHNNAIILVVEYDQELLLPLLMEVDKLAMLVIVDKLDASSLEIGNENFFYTTNTILDTLKDLVGK